MRSAIGTLAASQSRTFDKVNKSHYAYMAEILKVGDVVELRSGSLPMTITGVERDAADTCVVCWFHEGKTSYQRIPAAALKRVDSKDD